MTNKEDKTVDELIKGLWEIVADYSLISRKSKILTSAAQALQQMQSDLDEAVEILKFANREFETIPHSWGYGVTIVPKIVAFLKKRERKG